ncbi:MAG: hypothetical protein ACNI27_07355 [Desulfovibrio sp.]
MALSDRERRVLQRCKDDFPHYAKVNLKIRTKSGKIKRFKMNRAQRYAHDQIEKQRKALGYVRVIILKGRQQGMSTYVGGRFYHKTTHRKGWRTYILTHEGQATTNLFEMSKRYHDNCHPLLKPRTGRSSARELYFDLLDSGYKVGTAGGKGSGRSQTAQCFHGSEVAFWPNAKEHIAGAFQAVPLEEGTEIILESTANGLGNTFHELWQKAEAGDGDFIAIFVPWFWQDEYQRPVPDDFEITEEEEKYQRLHGLSLEQVVWMRAKIVEMGPVLFKQEYPATSAEAFQTTGVDSLIPAELVLEARRGEAEGHGPTVVGVDPAWDGVASHDRSGICFRQGRRAFGLQFQTKKNTMEVTGICRGILDSNRPHVDMMFIDVGGIGAGVYDRLKEMGYGKRVRAVNFGGKAMQPEKYFNKRSEMWGEMKEWMEEIETLPTEIPDSDALHADLTGPSFTYDSSNRMVLESKKDMVKRGLRSPDGADALALTFAQPVRTQAHTHQSSYL